MKLQLGPIVGATSDREARIWLRADRPEDARVHVFRDSGTEVPGSPFRVEAADNLSRTATVVAQLPAAYARYTYDVRDDAGASVLPAWLGAPSFWSAPKPDTTGPFRFGLVSCNNTSRPDPEGPWRALYETADELDLAFLLCVGDQLYADGVWDAQVTGKSKIFDPTLRDAYEKAYQAQWDFRWFRRTLANFPTYMTWDDHEIRNGWGSERLDGSAAIRQQAFAVVRDVYRRFQHDHNPPSFGGPDDLFYAFEYGNAGFLVLDGRGARDMEQPVDPLLGARQWKLMKQWLRDETPGFEALFVVASVPPVHVPPKWAKPGGPLASDIRDQWTWERNLPELERLATELLDRANEHDIPIVLLSGDVHLGTVACLRSSRPEHAKRPTIHQLCSSPITNNPPKLPAYIRKSVGGLKFEVSEGIRAEFLAEPLDERNFGVVELSYETDRYHITLKLFDETGVERLALHVG
jgi:alkaline phosphatase D